MKFCIKIEGKTVYHNYVMRWGSEAKINSEGGGLKQIKSKGYGHFLLHPSPPDTLLNAIALMFLQGNY